MFHLHTSISFSVEMFNYDSCISLLNDGKVRPKLWFMELGYENQVPCVWFMNNGTSSFVVISRLFVQLIRNEDRDNNTISIM